MILALLPGHSNIAALSHDLWNVFRFVNGIVNKSFKQCHFYALSNGVSNGEFHKVVGRMTERDNVIVYPYNPLLIILFVGTFALRSFLPWLTVFIVVIMEFFNLNIIRFQLCFFVDG